MKIGHWHSGVSAASGRRGEQFDPKKKLPVAVFHARVQGSMFDVGCSIINHKSTIINPREVSIG